MTFDPFGARDQFDTGHGTATLYRLSKLEEAGLGESQPASIFDSSPYWKQYYEIATASS